MATPKPIELSDNDLPQILNVLSSISMGNVINFGLNLNVGRGNIEGFERRYHGNMRDCLREILNERLKQELPLTWHDIVAALRSPAVHEHHLARQIESQYITHSQLPSSVPQLEGTQLSSVPQLKGIQLSSVPQLEGTQLSSVPQREGNQLSSVPQREENHLSSVPWQERTQLPLVPQLERYELSSVTWEKGTQLSSVPQLEGTQFSSVPWQEGTQLSSVPQLEGTQLSLIPQQQLSATFSVTPPQQSLTVDSTPPQPLQQICQPQYLHPHPTHYTQHPSSHPPSSHSHYYPPPQLYPPVQSSYQPPPVNYSTELPTPSLHHHPLQYTATQLPSSQHHTHYPSSHPPLDHSHHQPLHPPAHPSQYIQLHSHSHYPITHNPTQFSFPQPPTNHQALTSYHKLPIQPSLAACSTTHSGSGSVLRETDPPAATLQPPVRPLLEPHPDSIPEQHGIKATQVKQHLIPTDPHSHSSATGLPRTTPISVTSQKQPSPYTQSSSVSSSIRCTSQTTPLFGKHQLYGDVSSQIQSGMVHRNAFIDYVKTIYRESKVQRDTSVVKWPPTPSKVYINLVCIDRHSVSGRSREYAEVTQAMVRDGNVDAIVNVTKGPIDFSEIAKNIFIVEKDPLLIRKKMTKDD